MQSVTKPLGENLTQESFLNTARWLVVASAIVVSLPTPLIGLTTGLFLLLWITIAVKFNCLGKLITNIIKHPIALPSLVLWVFFGLGIIWTSASQAEAWHSFGKYRELLLLPLMISVMDKSWLERVIYGFIIGHSISMALSFFQWFGYFPVTGMASGFHSHIQFSALEAFAIYATIIMSFRQRDQNKKILLLILAATMLFNLFMVNTGRSGYVVFLSILAMILIIKYQWKGILTFFIAATVSLGILYSMSTPFQQRANSTIAEIKNTKNNLEQASVHARPALWINAIKIIETAPLFGHGTGSFLTEYKKVSPHGESKNPHQQYLLIWAELGILGLGLLFYIYYKQATIAKNFETHEKYLAFGIIATFMSHTLFNSALMDNVEGHFFVVISAVLWSSKKSSTSL